MQYRPACGVETLIRLVLAEYARYFLQTTGVVRSDETIKLPSWEYLHPVENFVQPVRRLAGLILMSRS